MRPGVGCRKHDPAHERKHRCGISGRRVEWGRASPCRSGAALPPWCLSRRPLLPTQRRELHITDAAQRLLAGYPWPGNVREVANVIERAVALALTDEVDIDNLPEEIAGFRTTELPSASRAAAG